MPATTAQLTLDLERLLHRALSRSGTGAWEPALEAIQRAAQLLPVVARRTDHHPGTLRRCAQLLGDLRERFDAASTATRGELDQLRYARARLRPTRDAYTQPAAALPGQRRFAGTA